MLCRRLINSFKLNFQNFNTPKCLTRFPNYQNKVNLHNTASANKYFIEYENIYAHNILEHSLKPYQIFRLDATDTEQSLVDLNTKTEPALKLDSSADENKIFQHYCLVTQYCRNTNTYISEDRFKDFVQLFCRTIPKLSDAQLWDTLRRIVLLPQEKSSSADNFMDLWNYLDLECCRRIEKWNIDQILLTCDAWYLLRLARICQFVDESFDKLGRKVRQMKPEQLVHAMFFSNVLRRPLYDKYDFEQNLTQCADKLTLQELGVMSMGFFKTKTPIRSPELLKHLYARLMAELDTVEDITLVSILKILRYSSKVPFADSLAELLDGLCKQVDRLSLLSCLHVALMGNDLQYCHNETIERILNRFNAGIAETRLKDLERICLVIALFDFESTTGVEKEICQKVVKLLHDRADEIVKYPRSFTTCLHYLTVKGYYDKEMISTALEPKFMYHTYKANISNARELFHLDAFVKINLRNDNYDGHQLPEKYRRRMGKLLTNYIPEHKYKLSATDRVLLEIKEITDLIIPLNEFKHVLPHYERPDIVICYDKKQRKAISISSECPENYTGAILTRKLLLGELDTPDIVTVIIGVTGWNNVLRGTNKLSGFFKLKLNQLELLGHKHVVISWHEWRAMETAADRKNLLKRKLSTVINL